LRTAFPQNLAFARVQGKRTAEANSGHRRVSLSPDASVKKDEKKARGEKILNARIRTRGC